MTAAIARQGKKWKEGMEEGAARDVRGRWGRIHPWGGGTPTRETWILSEGFGQDGIPHTG